MVGQVFSLLPRFIHPENGIDNSFIGFALASAVAFALGF